MEDGIFDLSHLSNNPTRVGAIAKKIEDLHERNLLEGRIVIELGARVGVKRISDIAALMAKEKPILTDSQVRKTAREAALESIQEHQFSLYSIAKEEDPNRKQTIEKDKKTSLKTDEEVHLDTGQKR